jgi:hypothetical protein
MLRTIFFIILFAFSALNGVSQDSCKVLFRDGLYLENLKVIIPWKIKSKDFKLYGNPQIKKVNFRLIYLVWDSVKILNGISANVTIQVPKSIITRNKEITFTTFHCKVLAKDINVIRDYLRKCTGKLELISRHSPDYFYYWINEGIMTRVGFIKGAGGVLEIQRK